MEMVNGLHLYSAFNRPYGHPKRFTFCLTFTHSYADGDVSHVRHHPARREQLGLGVLLMDTSTLGQVEPGIEPPTFQFVANQHEPLSHCRPSQWRRGGTNTTPTNCHILLVQRQQMKTSSIITEQNNFKQEPEKILYIVSHFYIASIQKQTICEMR